MQELEAVKKANQIVNKMEGELSKLQALLPEFSEDFRHWVAYYGQRLEESLSELGAQVEGHQAEIDI